MEKQKQKEKQEEKQYAPQGNNKFLWLHLQKKRKQRKEDEQ